MTPLLLALAIVAQANATTTTPPPPRWYGAPSLAIDAGSLALMAGSVPANSAGLLLAGGVTFTLGAPIVHLANGRPHRALGSLGIRFLGGGLATGVVLVDLLSHPCDGEPSCQHDPDTALAIGAVVLATAALIDDLWLARE